MKSLNHDTPTQLPNRLLFMDRLSHELELSHRNKKPFVLLLIDLDRFKGINETFGYAAGDSVLQETEKRLRGAIRKSDTVARLDNDEFAVILPDISEVHDAEIVAAKIISKIGQPFRLEKADTIFISSSAGISAYPDDGNTAEQLLEKANTALSYATKEGGNSFYCFKSAMNTTSTRRKALLQNLRKALQIKEITVHYQPILDLESGKVTAAEVLSRWHSPELGNIPPTEFIPLAQQLGLLDPLGKIIIDQAVKQVGSWRQKSKHPLNLYLSMNFSPAQFQEQMLEQKLEKILLESGLSMQSFWMEISESFLMDEYNPSDILTKLKNKRAHLVLDNFCADASSRNLLKRYPIDAIKINRSFIRQVGNNDNNNQFIQSIISMAHDLGIKVIAQGVETEEQLDFLRHSQCDMAQGYYFARPMPASDFEAFLPGMI